MCESFKKELFAAYRRDQSTPMSYAEMSTLAAIVRERPRYLDEWKLIQTLRVREPRYFPQSLSRLLNSWQETIDRAAVWVPETKTVKSILEKELDSIR